MNYLLILVVVAVVAYLLLMVRSALKQRSLKRSRESKSFEDFSAEFGELEVSNSKAIELAYEDIGKLVGYSVAKEDELEHTLGLLPEDFEESLEQRSRSLGVENIYESAYAKRLPLKTAGDYVLLLDEILKEKVS